MLTIVTGYARWASAVLVLSRRAEDLFAGSWQLISGLEFEHDNPAPQAVEAGTALEDAGPGEEPLEGTAEAGGEHGEGEDAGPAAGNPAPLRIAASDRLPQPAAHDRPLNGVRRQSARLRN